MRAACPFAVTGITAVAGNLLQIFPELDTFDGGKAAIGDERLCG